MRKSHILLVFLLLSLGVNLVLGYLLINFSNKAKNDSWEFEKQVNEYPYISKRVLQEFPQDILINFLELRRSLRAEVALYGDEQFGVYFEYLPTGTNIGVNDRIEFHAASLFKVPVIMAYYHARERGYIKGDPLLTLDKDSIDNEFGNLWKKGVGYKLKSSKAVELTLTESDNTAAKSLVPLIEESDFNSVYEGLDIDLKSDDEGALISAKAYSSILKSLYFSSVINKDSSQEILEMLTRTKFPDKISAGVPVDVPVAHKIGDFIADDGKEGYRDCGIVYVPRRPYILCMFSVGDEQVARERMQTVSRMIYDYVSSAD